MHRPSPPPKRTRKRDFHIWICRCSIFDLDFQMRSCFHREVYVVPFYSFYQPMRWSTLVVDEIWPSDWSVWRLPMTKSQQSSVQSQQPPASWNLRGGKWLSVEWSNLNKDNCDNSPVRFHLQVATHRMLCIVKLEQIGKLEPKSNIVHICSERYIGSQLRRKK